MKVVGINGSSRKDGNTATLIKTIIGENMAWLLKNLHAGQEKER